MLFVFGLDCYQGPTMAILAPKGGFSKHSANRDITLGKLLEILANMQVGCELGIKILLHVLFLRDLLPGVWLESVAL